MHNEAHSAKLLNGSAWPESITTVEARSSDSGGSGADVPGAAAAADTAVITASEPAADAAVDDADRSAVASDDTVVIMEISNLQEDSN